MRNIEKTPASKDNGELNAKHTILKGHPGSGKTSLLIKKYIELINSGVPGDEILVLVQNSKKRSKFSAEIRKLLPLGAYPKLNIYTFFGLAYNFILDFWPDVEKEIKSPSALQNVLIEPNMCGLEVSQHIFRKCIETSRFQGYNSKINLLHQLFRRYSLIVQNALTDEEVRERTKILKESFTQEAQEAIKLYKAKTISLRAFDYLRQLSVFSHLYKTVQNPYRYVLLDDGDEITPACFEYLKHIKNAVKEFTIAYDPYGSSRLGYLSARITDFETFLGEKALEMTSVRPLAFSLFESIKAQTPIMLENIEFTSSIRRDEMIDSVAGKINFLLKNGVKPSDIVIVTPCIDADLRYFLKNINAPRFFLSGHEKLVQNPLVRGAVAFLKIINLCLESVSRYEYRSLCMKILNLSLENSLLDPSVESLSDFIEKVKPLPVSEQLYHICKEFINTKDKVSVVKLNQLMEQMRDFERVFGTEEAKKYAVESLEHTIISENPLQSEDIPENAIIAGTMQKIIDYEIRARYHFWLDISNSQWLKQDIGPLYNSWVFQKDWNKKDFDIDDNIELTLDKTARILRKLYLCATERVFAYSSVYDFSGVENFGGINKFFALDSAYAKKPVKISPRADQEAVLAYNGGKMAVSAVAGSGKTTVMLALILKFLEEGVVAENIFVLTFMESAARNFKERIKENFPHLTELPHISTIHGLALRILKEHNNYAHIGLDEDFEIVDEPRRLELLREIIFSFEMGPDDVELYDRAISAFKSQGSPDINRAKSPPISPLFRKVYLSYEQLLGQGNYIDYDDLLILALKLLKTNDAVRSHYQHLARYVIEDEAQDSSALQQELIGLLGARRGNIIRCGDVNQAITSTFSNSDVEGFKSFIAQNSNVTMDHSQRCSKKVYELANSLIERAQTLGTEAFLDVQMKPVKDKNPVFENGLVTRIFDEQAQEKAFVLGEIKKIFSENPGSSIGILLRSNWSVNEWASYMTQNSIQAVTRSDILLNNPVFEVVLRMFNFLLEPKNNLNVLELFKTFMGLGFYTDEKGLEEHLSSLQEPFIFSEGQNCALWWDLIYFLRRSHLQAQELALEIGDFYFKNSPQKSTQRSTQRSNIAPVSLIVAKLYGTHPDFETLVRKMNDIAKKPNYFGMKFFDAEKTDALGGKVQIMTMHKAKGDEFDFVFLPELTLENLPLNAVDVKLKGNTTFIEALKPRPKSPEELKREIVQENYRLLYVAITRAKKALIICCAQKYRKQVRRPCEFLEEILEGASR